jgi:hypothetical protein
MTSPKDTVEVIAAIVAMIVSILSLIVSVLGLIWDIIKQREIHLPDYLKGIGEFIFNPKIAWVLLVTVSLISAYLLWFRPEAPPNRLVTYHDFEGTDDGWSRILSQERVDEDTKSEFPRDDFFPGSMTSELTTDYALTGQSSLKVTTSVNVAGVFKSFLFREGAVTGNGITIYALAPDSADASAISYVQLCVPSHGWPCSAGANLVPGEWTPITLDLNREDEDGLALSAQKLTELAIQWVFETESGASVDLYFDSAEIFHSGP